MKNTDFRRIALQIKILQKLDAAVMRPDVLCQGVLCYNMIDELYERERKKR